MRRPRTAGSLRAVRVATHLGGKAIDAQKGIYQFKITLKGIEPPIWRRIAVPASYSFWDLHVAIQDAMGWLDCHLHMFRLGGAGSGERAEIGIPDPDGDDLSPCLAGWEVPLAAYLKQVGDRMIYEYDFGDGWEHEVTLEAIGERAPRKRYPICLGGERACPPEDCGGTHGYEELLAALADPAHPERDELLEWLGGEFDAEAFDPAEVEFDDPRSRWEIAFGDADD
ncbi:MAG: plasmid pRiA4b ORF-3 family protein [Armatimonadetes bacterium]|nr:plasmid pRiA4b ORF-3 family protein [Armatimonadota bacterium]